MERQSSGWEGAHTNGIGQGEPTPQKRAGSSAGMRRLLIIVLVGMVSTFGVLVVMAVVKRGVELTPPKISIVTEMKGLTSTPQEIVVSVVDTGVGLAAVNAWVQQGEGSKQLFTRKLERQGQFEEKITLSIPANELQPGTARLVVQAIDDSLWQNKSLQAKEFLVDEQVPTLAVVDAPAAFQEGDIALLVYRASDQNLQWSGLRIGKDEVLKGTPLSQIDPAVSAQDLFGIFFTLSEGEGPLQIEAVDANGNTARKTVRVSVWRRPSGVAVKESAPGFAIKELVKNLLNSGYDFGNPATRNEIAKLLPESQDGDRAALIRISKVIVNVSRQADLKQVRDAARQDVVGERWWRESGRLGLFTPKLEFADLIVLNDGVEDLASTRVDSRIMEPINNNPPVYSPYDGVVVLSQEIGSLGKSVLIDHGAGLSTFFYGLGRRDPAAKSSVSKGQKIGAVGRSGFNFADRLRMQVFLHGRSIDPLLILDGKRFYEQVDLRLEGVREKLPAGDKIEGVR